MPRCSVDRGSIGGHHILEFTPLPGARICTLLPELQAVKIWLKTVLTLPPMAVSCSASSPIKGKPVERRGRKAAGLEPLNDGMAARLRSGERSRISLCAASPDKGKPVERRGHKITGLSALRAYGSRTAEEGEQVD